jgi:phosphohistidine swiveling domain-containing protein
VSGTRLELTDPTLGTSEPGRCWTQTNINEAAPEVLSPLCWTFWLLGTDIACREAWFDFGLIPKRELVMPTDPNRQMVGCFYGRQAINVDVVREVIALAPGASPDGFEKDIFGYVRPDAPAVQQSRRRYPFVAVKLPVAIAVHRRRLEAVHGGHLNWWRTEILSGPITNPRALLADSLKRFQQGMRIHQYARANLLSTAQTQLTALAKGIGSPDLLTRLLGGFGAADETKIAAALWEMSRGRLEIDEFLREHGFHGPSEGNPISRSWREDRAPVHALAKAYAGLPDGDDPRIRQRTAAEQHHDAVRELLDALPAYRRPVAKLLLAVLGTQLARLSLGKASFLMAIDGARASVRALGADLVARGIADHPDDAFYLTYDELLGPEPENFAEVVAFRRERRAEYERLRLPVSWTGTPVPEPITDQAVEDSSEGQVISGTAGSPGVIEARVMVLEDPADGDALEPGDILVSRFTDPSWSALFALAGAVVVDIGGISSHGAVVAREMGVPCVIGTGDGSRRLQTGDLVRVDGGAGTVTILERRTATTTRVEAER